MKRYELPKDWRWVRLGEVVSEIKSGFACGKQHAVPWGIPHLRTNNIGINGELDLSVLIYLPAEIVDLNTYSLKSGDVLFNNTNSIELVGKIAILRENLPFVFSNHITRLRVNQDVIESEWLTLSLQYLWYQRFFERECQRWIGQAGFNTMRLKKVQIPLPPLPEQRRIVARIEELVNRVEEAKRLRRAAREETDAIMPAALYEVFSQAEVKGWRRVRLGEVMDLSNGKGITKKEMTDSGTYPVFGSNGIVGRTNNYLIQKRTIVIGRVGACGALNVTNDPAWISDNAMYVSKISNHLDLMFLYYGLQELNLSKLAKIAAQPSISQEPIKEQSIPFPPLPDQHRIVTYLDSLQAKVEELHRLQEETQEEIDAMTSAILDKAFRGGM